jgi:uncharacterized protein with PIN domain
VIKESLAQPRKEATTEEEKAANCSGCGQRVRHRELREVHEEHVAFGYGVREGAWYCQPCARYAGVL